MTWVRYSTILDLVMTRVLRSTTLDLTDDTSPILYHRGPCVDTSAIVYHPWPYWWHKSCTPPLILGGCNPRITARSPLKWPKLLARDFVSTVQFIPWQTGSFGEHDRRLSGDPLPDFSAEGYCEQFWHGQGCPLFDVVHLAFPLPTKSFKKNNNNKVSKMLTEMTKNTLIKT